MTSRSWLHLTRPERAKPGETIDGSNCGTRYAFFSEVARVLSFPDYFGHNWDALSDCLRDACPVNLVVTDPLDLLADESDDQFAMFLDIGDEAAAAGFTLTLVTDAEHEPAVRERIADALE